MKIEVPDSMGECGLAELRVLQQTATMVAADAAKELERRGQTVASSAPSSRAASFAHRLEKALDGRERHRSSPWMIGVALLFVLILSLPTLLRAFGEFSSQFDAAKTRLQQQSTTDETP